MVSKFMWSLRWRARKLWHALHYPYNGHGHRFIDGRCFCGHKTTNDPERCAIDWTRGGA